MLCAVAVFWGAGFILNAQLLNLGFTDTPQLINAMRFGLSALLLAVIFNKKIRLEKHSVLYGLVGGALLFVGFSTQLIGIKYTTPSHSGFFTAAYIVLVPFIAWIAYRKRPHWSVFVGAAVAIVGFVVLNFSKNESGASVKGDMITLLGALCFALQIVWADYILKKNKTDYVQLTFWQVTFAAALFVLYTVIFESNRYAALSLDMGKVSWRLAIVVFGGTTFAYYAQTFAQLHLSPSETSLIMSCESPIGAFLSMAIGLENFVWQTIVGGVLVICAVVLVELVPNLRLKRKRGDELPAQTPETDAALNDEGTDPKDNER